MAAVTLPAEKFLGVVVGKGLDHGLVVSGFRIASQVASSQSPASASRSGLAPKAAIQGFGGSVSVRDRKGGE